MASEVESKLKFALLMLQICLAVWQTLKLTPFGALLESVMAYLLRPMLRLLSLSNAYTLLQSFPGCLCKTVHCHVFNEAPYNTRQPASEETNVIRSSYLGKPFTLIREGQNILLVDDKMKYYITEKIWQELLVVEAGLNYYKDAVFLKGYKEIWENVTTGRVMNFDEILDSVIIHKQYVRLIHDSTFRLLPVDLTVSEEKLLKVINLVGFFMQIKDSYWPIATLLSITSAVLEFFTPLRTWLYRKINLMFCRVMHWIFDPRSRSLRTQVYSLGKWVENLKPCNDIELRVRRRSITAIIAVGAKTSIKPETQVNWLECPEAGDITKSFQYMEYNFECKFKGVNDFWVISDVFPHTCFRCNREDSIKLMTLVSCMTKNSCGTLKSYDPNNKKVCVRGFIESMNDYSTNGFPDIYELTFKNVIVM